jgi:hypothetical protein
MKIGARRGVTAAARLAALGALAWAGMTCAGCGGGSSASGNGAPSSSSATPRGDGSGGAFLITSDDYGVENPTYLSATRSSASLILRAAVASSMNDPAYQTVFRIDISAPGALAPAVSYRLGPASPGPSFPGALYLFNGHQSTLLQTAGGTISFNSYGTDSGDRISGSFDAVIVDGGDSTAPNGSYRVAGSFSFTSGGNGPILPAPDPVPLAAPSLYLANCASCHSLGSFDSSTGSGPDVRLKGGRLHALFPAASVGHKGIALAPGEVAALKIFLNVN